MPESAIANDALFLLSVSQELSKIGQLQKTNVIPQA
jgi:hypothetical protein